MDRQFYIFRGIDYASAEKMREQLLASHRDYVRRDAGVKMLHGGPLYDSQEKVVGTCLIVEANSRQDVDTWLAGEPFFKTGLFAMVSVERWGWSYGR